LLFYHDKENSTMLELHLNEPDMQGCGLL